MKTKRVRARDEVNHQPRSTAMNQHVIPIPCKPWTLDGLPDDLIVGHYEDTYGAAVRTLNAVRDRLATLDLATAPAYDVRALKREELEAMGSVTLHELYFGSLASWRREFIAIAQSLSGGSGWALLTYSRRDGLLYNQIAFDHSQAMMDTVPLLALDMCEHAYHLAFRANATAYIDAFMRNIDWAAVTKRFTEATKGQSATRDGSAADTVPGITVEELAAQIAGGEPIQVIDARPKFHYSRSADMMEGAIYRDPYLVDEWCKELSPDVPVAVYCAYGFNVGCAVTDVLRQRGLDARFVRGGLSAWYALGGRRAITPQ